MEDNLERMSADGKQLYFAAISPSTTREQLEGIDKSSIAGNPGFPRTGSMSSDASVHSTSSINGHLVALDLDTGVKSSLEKMNEALFKEQQRAEAARHTKSLQSAHEARAEAEEREKDEAKARARARSDARGGVPVPVLKQALVQFYARKRDTKKANAAYVDKLFYDNPYAVIYRHLLEEYGKNSMPDGWREPRGVHEWELKSYKTPTYCAVCKGLLVGLYKQGYSCKRCKMKVHGNCVKRCEVCTKRNPWLDYQDRLQRQHKEEHKEEKEEERQMLELKAEAESLARATAGTAAIKAVHAARPRPPRKKVSSVASSGAGSFGDGDIWAEAMADADADSDADDTDDGEDGDTEMPSVFRFM